MQVTIGSTVYGSVPSATLTLGQQDGTGGGPSVPGMSIQLAPGTQVSVEDDPAQDAPPDPASGTQGSGTSPAPGGAA